MDASLSRALDRSEDARFWQGVRLRGRLSRPAAEPVRWADYPASLPSGRVDH